MSEHLLEGKRYTHVPFDIQRAIDPSVPCERVFFRLANGWQTYPVHSEAEGKAVVAETCRWLRDLGYKYFAPNPNDHILLSIKCIHVTRYGHDTAHIRFYSSKDSMHVDLQLQ